MVDKPAGEEQPWVVHRLLDRAPGEAGWARRYKTNVDRLRSGEHDQIEAVVDGLSERDRSYGLSQGERRMLERAKRLLEDPPDGTGGTAGVREPRNPVLPCNAGAIALPIPADAQPD